MSHEPAHHDALPVARYLEAGAFAHRIIAHDFSVEQAQAGVVHGFGSLEAMAPTLILRSSAGPIAAIVSGACRLSYKKIKKELGLADVSLASPVEVAAVTGAAIGCVSAINPGLVTIMDSGLLAQPRVYAGCGVPQFTLEIEPQVLIAATRARVFDFSAPKPLAQA